LADVRRAGLEPGLLLGPGLLCLIFAYFLPTGLLLVTSVLGTGTEGEATLTLEHYRRFFLDTYYLSVLERTFRLSLIITVTTLALGFPIAYIMARAGARTALWLGLLVITPLMVSVVIRTFGWMVLIGRGAALPTLAEALGLNGRDFVLMQTETGIVLALAQVLLPFMTLSLYGVIAQVDAELEQAARSMGCSFLGALWRVTLPLSLPGVVAGSLLVFALSISSFITPNLIGGVRLPMLASSIYQQALVTVDWPFAAVLSVILLLTVLAIVVPYTMVTRSRYR
jgi:putative spermidine/putrescine transport system permease protein